MVTVIKIGGSLLSVEGSLEKLVNIIESESQPCIVVHGGGPAVTSFCDKIGITPRFVTSPGGIRSRYTDYETIQAFTMVMKGRISSEIVTALQRKGIRSAGISGIDGPTLIAERKRKLVVLGENGRRYMMEGGYTGRIVRTHLELLNSVLQSGITPVVSPIALGEGFEILNVDGDRAASALAGAFRSDRMILLTNVDGVILDGKVVEQIRKDQLPGYIQRMGNGMDKKLMAAREALDNGCRMVVIMNGKLNEKGPELIEGSTGTVILP